MNKQRREKITKIANNIYAIKDQLQLILDEEQNIFDNMPENLQGSIRGSESEEAIDIITDAMDLLDECNEILSGI